MFGLICATALAAWILWLVFDGVRELRRNMKAARESGLTWIIARELISSITDFQFGVSFQVAET